MKRLLKRKQTAKPKYEFVENAGSRFYGIRVLRGRYKGVIFVVGEVSLRGEDPNFTLKFKYQVNDPGKYTKEKLESSRHFGNFVGDLLTEIIADTNTEITPNGERLPADDSFVLDEG